MNLADTNLIGALLDGLPLAVIVSDRHGRICMFNPAAEQIFGYRANDAMGLSVLELWASPADARRMMAAIHTRPIDQPASASALEVVFRRRDGEEVPGRLVASQLTDGLGEPTGVMGIFEDLREERAQDRQLGDAVEQLWEAEQRVAAVARMSTALHALSQPLTAAMGMVELMQDQNLPPNARERLVKVALQLERIRSGLGDLSRQLHAPPPPQRRFP